LDFFALLREILCELCGYRFSTAAAQFKAITAKDAGKLEFRPRLLNLLDTEIPSVIMRHSP